MIRAAKPSEVPTILSLLEDAIGGTQNADQLRRWIDDPDRAIWVDSALRGVLLGQQMGDEAEIIDLAVSPDHRRQGIGAALVRAFLAWLQAQSTHTVFLEVRASNTAAIALYTHQGFSAVAERPDYYGDGERALVLRWDAPC